MSGDSLSRSDIDAKLQKLERKLDQLRRTYEQFFVGARDRPPTNERRQVERLVRDLKQATISNTSQKFRMRGLAQRYTSYKQKWNRVERQIEQGTYQPHKKRAEGRAEDHAESTSETDDEQSFSEQTHADDGTVELDVEMEEVDLGSLEQELQEMDEAGEFEKYDKTERLDKDDFKEAERQKQQRRRPTPTSQDDDADDRPRRPSSGERGRQANRNRQSGDSDKLREIQDKLGLSGGSSKSNGSKDESKSKGGDRREKLRSMREKLDRKKNEKSGGRPPSSEQTERRSSNTESDQTSDQRDSGRQDRVIERSSRGRGSSRRGSSSESNKESSDDDEETHAERIYDRLIATKRHYGEPTDQLTFQAVRASMERQRRQLADREDATDVRFQVVVKDDQVYLQPVLR